MRLELYCSVIANHLEWDIVVNIMEDIDEFQVIWINQYGTKVFEEAHKVLQEYHHLTYH